MAIQFPAEVTTPVKELLESIDSFIVDIFEADKKRGTDRVAAFVALVDKHEMYEVEDAIRFAMKPVE